MKAETIEECFPFKDTPTVTWININGIHQVEIIEKIGKHLDLHPLIMEKLGGRLEELEDILVVDSRPEALQENYRLKKEMYFFYAVPYGLAGASQRPGKSRFPAYLQEGGKMKPKIIIILILLVLSFIFVIQNTTIVEVQLFFWKISMARIIMLSFMLLVGFIIGYMVAKLSERGKLAK